MSADGPPVSHPRQRSSPTAVVVTGGAAKKLRIVEKTLDGRDSILVAARRNGVAPNLLYRWRRLMLEGGSVAVAGDDDVTSTRQVREMANRIREVAQDSENARRANIAQWFRQPLEPGQRNGGQIRQAGSLASPTSARIASKSPIAPYTNYYANAGDGIATERRCIRLRDSLRAKKREAAQREVV